MNQEKLILPYMAQPKMTASTLSEKTKTAIRNEWLIR